MTASTPTSTHCLSATLTWRARRFQSRVRACECRRISERPWLETLQLRKTGVPLCPATSASTRAALLHRLGTRATQEGSHWVSPILGETRRGSRIRGVSPLGYQTRGENLLTSLIRGGTHWTKSFSVPALGPRANPLLVTKVRTRRPTSSQLHLYPRQRQYHRRMGEHRCHRFHHRSLEIARRAARKRTKTQNPALHRRHIKERIK